MALDLNIVTFLGSSIRLAYEVYDKGFKKEKSSPQRYIEFGSALHGLYSNLKTIETIITRANEDLKSDQVNAFGPTSFDLSPLTDIIGNFRLTLEECKELLDDGSKFRQKNGVITNILYNIDVDPQVVHLTERIAFHNNKIGLILDPFKLHIQSQLRNLQKEQHQDVAEMVQELRQLVITGLDLKDAKQAPAPPRDLEVPEEICQRFVVACGTLGQSKNESEGSATFADFPLREGLEAFFYHFNGLSQAVDSMTYLRLMKSIWIMDRIRESNEWAKIQRTNPGGLYDRCVREMDRRLRAECSRITDNQIPLPKLLLQLPDDTFSIWPPVVPSGQSSNVNHLGVLLDVPVLPDPGSHTLRIVRNIDGTLGVEDTTVTTAESTGTLSSEMRIRTLNIDPTSAYLVPVYAVPFEKGSHSAGQTVKLQASRDGVNGVTPELESASDLLKLQHLITGYRCVKQRNGVQVTSLSKGQDFPTRYGNVKKELFEYGNIQFWQRTPFESNPPAGDIKSDVGRRGSLLSSPTTIKSTGSSMSFSTLATTSSAHTRQVTVGSSGTGIQISQPEPPRLVLFLKEVDHGLLSFLVVELDELTHVNPFSCKCGSPKKTCTISVIERSNKPLLARRFYAQEGLNSWNVAALGEHWPLAQSGSVEVQNMYWLRVNFGRESERVKFNDNLASLVKIFTGRMDDYRKDLKNIRGTHIVSRRG